MFFKRANSVEKQLLNFRNASFSHCFRIKFVTDYHWNNLGLSNYKRMKRNLELRKNTTYFKKHLFIRLNVHQNILPRTVE